MRMNQLMIKPSKVLKLIISLIFLLSLTLPLSSMAASGEAVHFKAADGYQITGTLSGNQASSHRRGIVLLHMYKNNRQSWQPLVRELNRQGFVSLAIDLRGHGDSRLSPQGHDDSLRVNSRDAVFFNQMYQDAEAAVKYLVDKQHIPPNRIAMIGASVGCSVLFDAASRGTFPLKATAVMTPGRDYLGIPTMEHIKKWPGVPLLILSSKEESSRGADDIFQVLKEKGAELKTYDEEDIHGTHMFGEIDGIEGMIADWFAQKVPKE